MLRDALHGVLDKLQFGQVLLATVGSTAPFVGLLGTVWGIYHALTGIATAGQITIDKVAGPVGEALIMTAAGLAVAIPAVLGYNVFGRLIGRIEADLEGFARDLRELLAHARGRRGGPAAERADGFRPAGAHRRAPQPMSDINMTPLVDVMLVLVVIFIITAPLMASSLRLDLPQRRRRPALGHAQVRHRRHRQRRRPPSSTTSRSRPSSWPQQLADAARQAAPTPRCSCAPTSGVPYGRVVRGDGRGAEGRPEPHRLRRRTAGQ